jgi:ribosomal protein S18 acetylase RimI-like enzyme
MLPEVRTEPSSSHFAVVAELRMRPCIPADLELLEWYGMYRDHREIFVDAFARHLRGENIMLVAELNEYPVAQTWVDLVKRSSENVGYIWAVRVFPVLRGMGIGTRLMEYAEEVLRERGFVEAEVGVEKSNEAAHRLYTRLGYVAHGELREEYGYTTPDGVPMQHVVEQWILRKRLDGEPT